MLRFVLDRELVLDGGFQIVDVRALDVDLLLVDHPLRLEGLLVRGQPRLHRRRERPRLPRRGRGRMLAVVLAVAARGSSHADRSIVVHKEASFIRSGRVSRGVDWLLLWRMGLLVSWKGTDAHGCGLSFSFVDSLRQDRVRDLWEEIEGE